MTDIPDDAVEAARQTRAFKAGRAFDVPGDGVEQFTADILAAATPHIETQATADLHARIEALRDEWQAEADQAVKDGNYPAHSDADIAALDALIGGAK